MRDGFTASVRGPGRGAPISNELARVGNPASSATRLRTSAHWCGDLFDQRLGVLKEFGPALRGGHVHPRRQLLTEKFRQRLRLPQRASNASLPWRANETVGIVFGRQEQKANLLAVLQLRQAVLERPPGGLAALRSSPSKQYTTLSLCRSSFCTCQGVVAVPSVATA